MSATSDELHDFLDRVRLLDTDEQYRTEVLNALRCEYTSIDPATGPREHLRTQLHRVLETLHTAPHQWTHTRLVEAVEYSERFLDAIPYMQQVDETVELPAPPPLRRRRRDGCNRDSGENP